jgi:hypothetical protein
VRGEKGEERREKVKRLRIYLRVDFCWNVLPEN